MTQGKENTVYESELDRYRRIAKRRMELGLDDAATTVGAGSYPGATQDFIKRRRREAREAELAAQEDSLNG